MNEGPLLAWKGRRVRSPGDTPEVIARKVPTGPLRPGSLFFVPSPLEGWGLEVLLDRLPADGAVVVFEKDPELEERCRQEFYSFLGHRVDDPRLFRLETDTESAVQALFQRLPLGRLRRCEWLTVNGAWVAHGPRYRELFARIDRGLTRWWSNRMTEIHLGPLWTKNLIDNLQGLQFPGLNWPDWGEAPVLVCGAGPSLESAVTALGQQRSRWRVLAADTALSVLKAGGIVPDAVVCVEAQHANLRDFAGWLGADVQLFADLTSLPAATRIFRHPPHWFISRFAPIQLWERWPWASIPCLPPLGSVGVVAAWIAWRLTRGPVVLAGLDFSFPPGKTHAREAPSLGQRLTLTDRLRPVEIPGTWQRPGQHPSSQGWLTTPVMEGYAQTLIDQARSESTRTWVWSDQGLPLGLPRWPSQGPLEPLPSLARPERPKSSGSDRWLQDEKNRWELVLRTFEAMNRAPDDESVWSVLEQQLRAVDYLTFSFPDPEFRRDSDWLIRAQVHVRWALGRISPRLRS